MDANEYQRLALHTAAAGNLTTGERKAVFALGQAGEALEALELLIPMAQLAVSCGKVAEHVKKEIGHGHAVDRERMVKELGDVAWYLAGVADCYGIELGEVFYRNIEKLKARYPDGFSSERSITRKANDV